MKTPLIAVLLLAVSSLGAQSTPPTVALVPKPREITIAGVRTLAHGVAIDRAPNDDDRFAADNLAERLREQNIPVRDDAAAASLRVSLLRAASPSGARFLAGERLTIDSTMRDEGYVLVVRGARATVVGATPSAVFYGVQTLKQLIEGRAATAFVHEVRIRDWPALRYRGLHDDLSRGPLPTLEFQKKQIRTFAAYKINVYSPYYEHTLFYRSHPLVAPPGGAMSHEDVRELVAYARRYHIDVIPEQEAFGHLHHMLKYEIYSPLAETPHGHVLAPGQAGSMQIIRDMFTEIDSLFPSRFMHLGADETFELGRGQTAQRVQTEGIGEVYLGFLKQIEEALRPTGKRFLFWGDIAQNHPDLVKTLPHDLVAVAWEYGPAPSFDRLILPFTQAGIETWVAPGVNNWNRVYPNFDNALRNIQGFVRDGQRLGVTGVLNTTWDDDGEALFNQTWYGVLFGAAASWQQGESSIDDFQRSYGRAFHGDTTGAVDDAQRKLIAAHVLLQQNQLGDASDFLFWLDPYTPDGALAARQIRPIASQLRVLAESAMVLVARARQQPLRETDALDALELGARRIDFLGMKFQFADEIADLYGRAFAADTTAPGRQLASRALGEIVGINARGQDMRDGFSLLRDLYEQAWLKENRPYWLGNVLTRYDLSRERWVERIDRVTLARREYGRTRRLPPADSLGLGGRP
jgi:hexosaminidase